MSYAAFTLAEGVKWPEWKSIPKVCTPLSPPLRRAPWRATAAMSMRRYDSTYAVDSAAYLAEYSNVL